MGGHCGAGFESFIGTLSDLRPSNYTVHTEPRVHTSMNAFILTVVHMSCAYMECVCVSW
jgi:hypothetical protein